MNVCCCCDFFHAPRARTSPYRRHPIDKQCVYLLIIYGKFACDHSLYLFIHTLQMKQRAKPQNLFCALCLEKRNLFRLLLILLISHNTSLIEIKERGEGAEKKKRNSKYDKKCRMAHSVNHSNRMKRKLYKCCYIAQARACFRRLRRRILLTSTLV